MSNKTKIFLCIFLATFTLLLAILFPHTCYGLQEHETGDLLENCIKHDKSIKPEAELNFLILNSAVTVVIAIATCVYMLITWYLLKNARKEHKDNLNLTKRIHSDSLTPCLYLEGIEYDLIIAHKTNSDIYVSSLGHVKDNKITINTSSNNYSVDDFTIKGTIRLDINNASTNIADSFISIDGLNKDLHQNSLILPNKTNSLPFVVDMQLSNTSELQLLLDNQKTITIIASAKGAGLSAEDKFVAKSFITIKKSKSEQAYLSIDNWRYEERRRIYTIENNG